MENQVDLIMLDSGDIVLRTTGSSIPQATRVHCPHPITEAGLDTALAHQIRRVERLKRAHQTATIALRRMTDELTLAGDRLDKLKRLIPDEGEGGVK